MFFSPHPFGFHDSSFVRAPPRPASPPRLRPTINTEDTHDAYQVTLRPPAGTVLDASARLSHGLVVEGSVSTHTNSSFEYITRARAGVYSEPSQRALLGIAPAGTRIEGSAPSGGWIETVDGEWMCDDGSLALVRRPAPSRSLPFAQRIALPDDADLRRATCEPVGKAGGLLVTVPKVTPPRAQRQHANVKPTPLQPPAATKAPINAKRMPQPPPPKTPQPAPAAAAKSNTKPAAPKPAAPKPQSAKDMSADEYKQRHKRQAAEKRGMADALKSLDDGAGPVLTECTASSRNVQSPTEREEEWLATREGGFVRSPDGSPLSEKLRREGRDDGAHEQKRFKPVSSSPEPMHEDEDENGDVKLEENVEEENELAYYGF